MSKEEEMFMAIANLGKENATIFNNGITKAIDNMMKHEMLPKDALAVGDENVEKTYAEAYRLYNNGKYEESKNLFVSLLLLNPLDPRYLFGIAACLHMQKDYQIAAENYVKCALLDAKNPVPYYHASDCYLQMQDNVSAMAALQFVIERASDKPEFSAIKDRCQLTLESLIKQTGADRSKLEKSA